MKQFNSIKSSLGRWFAAPWYPFAFSLYPGLALLSTNLGQVDASAGVRVLLASLAFGAILYLLFGLILRQAHRAALLATLWMALFFSYGHVYNLIKEKYPDFNSTPWLLSAWGVLALVFIWWITRPKLDFSAAALSLNVVTLGLVLMSGGQVLFGSTPASSHKAAAEFAPIQDLTPPEGQPLPDVYYFILDSYGRDDLLKSAYGYDNSAFIKGLNERGFYVAECSQSNYVRTEISLGSSLNMQYLQDLDSKFTPDSEGRGRLWDSLKHSAARYDFESLGYKTVDFATGFAWNELRDADYFYSPPPLSSGLSEFEGLFLRTTLARYAEELGWVDSDAVMGQGFRDRFNNVFDSLDDLAGNPEPTFAYIHLISPHPPFVFGPDGEPTSPPDFWNDQRMYPADLYAKGYQNQLTHLNAKMLEGIDTILKNSDTPPIIVIQGDHGPWLQPKNKRMWILNAYYLPGHNDKLYSTITPVNTFRLILDTYFGGDYPLLKDVSYFSPVPKLYQFSEIPNTCEK
jgi:hypothetical protein